MNQINYIQENQIEIFFEEKFREFLFGILNRKLVSKNKYYIWINIWNEKQLKDFIINFENDFDIDERVIDFLIDFSEKEIKRKDIPIPFENQILIDNFLLEKYQDELFK